MITNNGQQYQQVNNNNAQQFIDLSGFTGSGEVGRYLEDHTGVLMGIVPRGGTYRIKDRRTGQLIERPNSWTAMFEDGNMVSWPTYVDPNTGQVMPWSRFDQSINLAEVVKQRKLIHLWKDDRKFFHLEVVEETTNLNPLPIMNAPAMMAPVPAPIASAPAPAPAQMPTMPSQAPWEGGVVYQQ